MNLTQDVFVLSYVITASMVYQNPDAPFFLPDVQVNDAHAFLSLAASYGPRLGYNSSFNYIHKVA